MQSGLAVFAGVFIVALADAFIAGFSARVVNDFIAEGGHLLVSAPGYAARREAFPSDRYIPDSASVERELRAVDPFLLVFPAIRAAVVVSRGSSEETATVACRGIVPWSAGSMNPAYESMPDRMQSGRFLEGAGDSGMVLTSGAAKRIGASSGDRIIFLCEDRYGSFNAVELPLIGILRDGASFSADSCFIDMRNARRLVGLEDGADEIAVYAADRDRMPLSPRAAEPALKAAAEAVAGLGLESTRWDELSSSLSRMLDFLDIFMFVIYAMFAVVAAVGITNSVLLSVQDRVRDLGTLRAIAFTKRQVSVMLLFETFLVSAASSALAVLAAFAVSGRFAADGFALPASTQALLSWMPAEVRPLVVPSRFALAFAAGSILPALAAAWPVSTVNRMSIREALGFSS
ncbi:MAG: ABC transporter permease [Spirochaetes bacterium]|nr:ABC transporter permease [Spirochaetota bacterium]